MKKLNNIINIALILSFLGLSNCSHKGEYHLIEYNTVCKINLHNDNQFVHVQHINSEIDTFYGTWTINKDTVNFHILKPDVFLNADSLSTVKEHIIPEKNRIYFEVNYNNSSLPTYAQILINGKSIVVDENGKVDIPKREVTEFTVISLGSLAHKDYIVKDIKSNHFIIQLHYVDVDSYSILRVEPKTKYLKRRNKLIPIDHNNEELYYSYKKKLSTTQK